jgi:hypothetical protein
MFGRYSDEVREEGLLKIAALLSLDGDLEKTAAALPRELAKNSKKVVDFLATPFRNISSGYRDYKDLSALRSVEVGNLRQALQGAATGNVGAATPEITSTMAEKIWSKAAPLPNAPGPNTQQLLGEAKGRMIGGALQLGIPAAGLALYAKSKRNDARKAREAARAASMASVPYNMQAAPQMYVVTRNGVHQMVPHTQTEVSEKTSAALPKWNGAITGAKSLLAGTAEVATPTVGKLNKLRGITPNPAP